MEEPMGNYLAMASQQQIRALLQLQWSHRRIARELGVNRETVGRLASKLEADREGPPAGAGPENRPNPIAGSEVQNQPNPITGPASAAEPFRDVIKTSVGKGLTAQRIWQDLCNDHGYGHSYLSVQRFVRRLKRQHGDVSDVMEHPPGQEAQVDYFRSPALTKDADGRWRRPWVFRMTLSCSKHGYEEPLWGQDRPGFLSAHEHAFEKFGGVPRVVRHDNLKAAVVRACLFDPDVSDVYEAFARHWGFVSLPGRPYHPEEQGVAENSGGYVKSNALRGRRFESLEAQHEFLTRWNRTIAQLRIHGTTRKQVLTHFLEVEKPALQELPPQRFELFEVGTRTVHGDGHVEVDSSYYSTPHRLLGQEVKVHWDTRMVRVYSAGEQVAVHAKLHVPGSWSTRPEDRPEHKPARQRAYQETLVAKAERIGDQAAAWARAAIEERDVRAYRLLQGMIALTRKHPRERVDWACGVALEQWVFRYRTLKRLAEQAQQREAVSSSGPALLQEHEVIRPLEQYAFAFTTTMEVAS